MQCTRCGADGTGKFCEYCGCELPKVAPDTVVINNYYQKEPEPAPAPKPVYNAPPIYNQPQYNNFTAQSRKSKSTALILCILFGYFGVHQFYVGKSSMGVLYLFTMGLFGIGWIVDIIMIATGTFKDNYGLQLK